MQIVGYINTKNVFNVQLSWNDAVCQHAAAEVCYKQQHSTAARTHFTPPQCSSPRHAWYVHTWVQKPSFPVCFDIDVKSFRGHDEDNFCFFEFLTTISTNNYSRINSDTVLSGRRTLTSLRNTLHLLEAADFFLKFNFLFFGGGRGAQQPTVGQGLLIHEVSRSYTMTDHSR